MGSMEGAEEVNKIIARIEEEQATDDDKIIVKLVMVVKKVQYRTSLDLCNQEKKSMIMLNPYPPYFLLFR